LSATLHRYSITVLPNHGATQSHHYEVADPKEERYFKSGQLIKSFDGWIG